MCKRSSGFLLVALLLFAGNALAQGLVVTTPPAPTIFVSTFTGHTIVRIQGNTSTVIHNGSEASEFPEGLVVGPDKKIYYCDSDNNRIFRMNFDGTQFETVYSGNPPGPEGPSFQGSDLIFNTRGPEPPSTGVWKIANVANIGFGGSIPAPVNVFPSSNPPAGTGSTWGEGTTFAPDGTLLIVDRSHNRVLKSSPPYNSTSVLITGLDTPIGIAAKATSGGQYQIYVGNGGATNNIKRFNSDGSSGVVFTSFAVEEGPTDSPAFMRFDTGTGNLIVATSQTGRSGSERGKVWSVNPSGAKSLIVAFSCSTEGCTRPAAIGVGLIPTPASVRHHFDRDHTSNLYDYGTDTVRLSFVQVFTSFDLTFTRTDITPAAFEAELNPPPTEGGGFTRAAVSSSSTGPFPPGTTCWHYSSENGFCTFYAATGNIVGHPGGLPQQGIDYAGKYTIKIAYFSQDTAQDPGIAHEHEGSPFYDEDMQPYFFSPSATPGTDPAGAGQSNGFSKFAMINKPLVRNGNFCGFERPLNISGRTFEAGEPIEAEFRLTTGPPPCGGNNIRDAIARLSLSLITPQGPVLITNIHSVDHKNTGNLFRFDDGEYEFDLSTKGLKPGLYQLTVTSNSFKPQSVFFRLRGDGKDRDDDDGHDDH